jgi:hypothetical protein
LTQLSEVGEETDKEAVAGSHTGSHPDEQLARKPDGNEHSPARRAEVTD